MALPVVPIAATAAIAAAGYWFFLRKPAAAAAPGQPAAPTSPGKSLLDNILPAPPSPSAPSGGGNEMPADVRAAYEELLARGTNPDAMEACANKLESLGFTAEALKLRTRAAQLRAQQKPTPAAPIPVAPAAPALPTLSYSPDLTPMPQGASNGSYYYNPSNGKRAKINVRDDARALRFLGYTAPIDPGGGQGLGPDSSNGQGSWHPQMQDAVKSFQSAEGLTVDGWLGPQTLTRIGQRVAAKSAANAQANAARGVADVTFAGSKATFGLAIPARGRSAFVRSAGGIRLRLHPQALSGTSGYAGADERVALLQVIPGEKLEASSPGTGGWALVQTYLGERGWAPMEWLGLVQAGA